MSRSQRTDSRSRGTDWWRLTPTGSPGGAHQKDLFPVTARVPACAASSSLDSAGPISVRGHRASSRRLIVAWPTPSCLAA